MAALIRKHFPGGVLAFIGQRQYESAQRYEKGNVWRNPWVPGQVGASPIQNWPSLLVWLYIFDRGGAYNPLYERGFERIGCWLCPATDLGEFAEVEKHSIQNERWRAALAEFAARKGMPAEWIELGLYRWKRLPKGMVEFLEQKGMDMPLERPSDPVPEEYLDSARRERIARFACISEDHHAVRMKALFCTGCGICLSTCEQGALAMDGRVVDVDPEKCVGCGKCLHPCVVVDFPSR
jgi:phosphoadenosine phosphosulfate reductase